MNLKKYAKRLMVIATSLLMTVTNMQLPVRAAGGKLTYGSGTGISYRTHGPALEGNLTNDWNADTPWLYLDGDVVFCVDPSTIAQNGATGYVESDFSESLKTKMSLAALHGYYEHGKTAEWYMASQFMVWEARGWTIDSTSLSNYASMKRQIQNAIDHHYDKPSFNGDKDYTVNVGETLTLNDTNGVVSEFDIQSVDGVNITKSGDTLKITPTADAPNTIKLTGSRYRGQTSEDTIVYKVKGNTSQAVSRLDGSDPVYFNVTINVQKYGKLEITKQDEDGTYVPNTSFKLSKNSDMSSPIGTYTTGADGKVTVNDLLPSTYYVQEVAVPNHLVLDSTVRSVQVQPNQTTEFNAKNNWVKGKIKLRKLDPESGKQVPGATYAIYNNQGKELERLVTTATGYVESGYLRFGQYVVKEVIAASDYVLNDTVYPVTISSNEQRIEVTGHDVRQRGRIEMTKEDSVTGGTAQGEATLEGAVYELRARENIMDPSKDGTVIHQKDSVVATLTTDKEGKASVDDLYLGQYFLVEKASSNGYTLDPTEYDIDVAYAGQTVEVTTKQHTVKERVISQPFSIIKISDNGNGEADNLKGVEFTIKSQKDIDKYGGWEKAPIAKNAKGEDAAILVTDKKGYAVSDELPYGTYVVRETKVPADHYAVPDFTVVINEDSREPQPWRIFNDEKFKAVVAIVKQDADTGKTIKIPGATFKIRDLETNEYVGYWEWNPLPHYVDEWTTNEDGVVMTGDVLEPKEYQIEEVKSPNGYLLNTEPLKFKVSSDTAYETLPDGKTPVITVKFSDKAVQGQINVQKLGDVLTKVKTDKMGNKHFIYEERGLAGAVYEIKAAKDIMDPSNDGTILYKKGTVVDTVTTTDGGKATTKKLPLGLYTVSEKQSPDGFVLNGKSQTVELKYEDAVTEVVFADSSFKNERQKVDLSIIKKDADTGTPLTGAAFGLYAKNDIKNADGKVVVKADELVYTADSDENGLVKFNTDLPLSEYYGKELKSPIGYSSSDEIIDFDATYQGQDIATIELSSDFKNEITKVEISKKDITNDEEIEGAHLKVYPKDRPSEVFETWISGQDGKNEDGTIKPHLIRGLEPNVTYVLHEESSPYGYALAQDVEFTVLDTGEIQSVEMKDEMVFGQLKWNKSGEIFMTTDLGQTEFGTVHSPIWEKSNLLGAEITIYAAEDITIGNHTYYKAEEEIQTLESDWDAVLSKKLPVGRYFYTESKVPHGYIVDTEKHYFEVKDNQVNEIQTITSTLKNERPTVDIDMTKVLEEQKIFKNPDAYKDIVFGIFAREDIYNYKGDVAIPYDTLVYTSGIDKDGHLTLADTFDLPNGVFYIKELSTNGQYVLNDNEYDFEIAYHGEDVSNYVVQIGEDGKVNNELARGTIQVQKVDTNDADKKLEGIKFNISANEDMSNIIETAETDAEGIATFSDLELGTYFLQEDGQVDGYVLNDHVYKVEVKTDGDLLTITCENKPTEMEFSKVGETGTEELEGAKLQVIDKETGDVVDEWISGKEPHTIKYLIEGKEYTMKEVQAPYAYEIAEEITFVAGDGDKVTMKDKLIRSYIKVKKVDYYNHEDILKVAEFTLYEDAECTKPIKVAKTSTEDGIALFDNLTYGTLYIKESKAPAGYQLSDEVVKVVIDDNWVAGDDKTRTIIYPDKPLDGGVVTGNASQIMLFAGVFVIAGAAFVIVSRKRRNTK